MFEFIAEGKERIWALLSFDYGYQKPDSSVPPPPNGNLLMILKLDGTFLHHGNLNLLFWFSV